MRTAINTIISFFIITPVLLAAGYVTYIAATDYYPAEYVSLGIKHNKDRIAHLGDPITITTFNIGYAGLDHQQDFFVDGGKSSRPSNEQQTRTNLKAISTFLAQQQSDIYLLQEVDIQSKRSYDINEAEYIRDQNRGYSSTFAFTNKSKWIPVPILHPVGYANGGLLTMSKLQCSSSQRIRLPGQAHWFLQLFDADRAIIESRIPVDNGRELVLLNLHLSAYDKGGSIRKRQLEFLESYIAKERAKENYMIIGGDWNHILPETNPQLFSTLQASPAWLYKLPELFSPAGFKWAIDKQVATVRTLNTAYTEGVNYRAVIDGFLVSSNIDILYVRGHDLQHHHSDHNPVTVQFVLTEDEYTRSNVQL